MNGRPMVDPRLTINIHRHYPQEVTIQNGTPGARSSTGSVGAPSWANAAGMVDIPCAISPVSVTQQKSPDKTTSEASFIIGLSAWYPFISVHDRALVDNDIHDIVEVEHDYLRTRTQLKTRILSDAAVAGQ